MIPSSVNFEVQRQAAANNPTAKIYLELENYALAEYGTIVTPSSTFSAKFPVSGAINGEFTQRNFGLDVGDTGYDNLFPALNGWKAASTGAENLVFDLQVPRQVTMFEIYFDPIVGGVYGYTYTIQSSLDGTTWTTVTGFNRVEGHSKNVVASATNFNSGTGVVTCGDTFNRVIFGADIVARFWKIIFTPSNAGVYTSIDSVKITRWVDVSDRVKELTMNQSMTYNLKRYMGRASAMTLDNYDGALSPTI